ncbi:MAG: hypothetical protein ACKOKE_01030 [Actinomycetota bacterium]
MGNLLLILVPAAFVVLGTAAYLTRSVAREAATAGGVPPEPIWMHPLGFAVLAALGLIAVLVIAPRLLGITFLFIPFLWSRGPGRRRDGGDRGRPDRPGPFD